MICQPPRTDSDGLGVFAGAGPGAGGTAVAAFISFISATGTIRLRLACQLPDLSGRLADIVSRCRSSVSFWRSFSEEAEAYIL